MRSVGEFAKLKGVSPARVYDLVADGVLPHRRVGRTIVIDDAALYWSPQRSRPLSARMARALVDSLEGRRVDGLRDSERARVRSYTRRLRESAEPERLLSSYLQARALVHHLIGASEDLPDLRADGRITVSGVSSPVSRMASSNFVEGYVAYRDFPAVKREHLLRSGDIGSESVRLRVLSFDLPISTALVAADLADWGRSRESREARAILLRLLG